MPADVIDALAGIAPGSALDAARQRRPQARSQAQASHDALFHPADPGGMNLVERYAAAAFVAGLMNNAQAQGCYGARLAGSGAPPVLPGAIAAASAGAAREGPYGTAATPPVR